MLRFEYDAMVARHPYRTDQPWDMGGIRILQVDGVNGGIEETEHIRRGIRYLEESLAHEWWRDRRPTDRPDDHRSYLDNHYGYTVRVEGIPFRPEPGDGVMSGVDDAGMYTYYQLRFSDGSLYVWLMPGPP